MATTYKSEPNDDYWPGFAFGVFVATAIWIIIIMIFALPKEVKPIQPSFAEIVAMTRLCDGYWTWLKLEGGPPVESMERHCAPYKVLSKPE